MNDENRLSRREFLALAAAAGATLLVRSRLPAISALWRARRDLWGAQLVALLAHRESARIVGLEYLRKYPHESDAGLLLDRIVAAGGGAAILGVSGRSLRVRLDQTIREDFAAERVVILSGWVLSVTEARLCALATLT